MTFCSFIVTYIKLKRYNSTKLANCLYMTTLEMKNVNFNKCSISILVYVREAIALENININVLDLKMKANIPLKSK